MTTRAEMMKATAPVLERTATKYGLDIKEFPLNKAGLIEWILAPSEEKHSLKYKEELVSMFKKGRKGRGSVRSTSGKRSRSKKPPSKLKLKAEAKKQKETSTLVKRGHTFKKTPNYVDSESGKLRGKPKKWSLDKRERSRSSKPVKRKKRGLAKSFLVKNPGGEWFHVTKGHLNRMKREHLVNMVEATKGNLPEFISLVTKDGIVEYIMSDSNTYATQQKILKQYKKKYTRGVGPVLERRLKKGSGNNLRTYPHKELVRIKDFVAYNIHDKKPPGDRRRNEVLARYISSDGRTQKAGAHSIAEYKSGFPQEIEKARFTWG